MCKFAPDKMKSIASEIVPVIFFGEHDTDKATAECWKGAWESLTSGKMRYKLEDCLSHKIASNANFSTLALGTRSMVTLYLDEIIEFLHPHLSSQYWRMKQTAALTIADLCKTAGKALGAHVDKVMPIMVSTLNTRYWAGKETVLDAFVQLCLSSPTWFDTDKSPSLNEVYQVWSRSVTVSILPLISYSPSISLTDFETRKQAQQ